MGMHSAVSRSQALRAMDLPNTLYFTAQGLNRSRIVELLLTESDGEWWYNPESVTKQCRLDGLTEAQVNVKLCTGHTHCPKCKHDLAAPSTIGADQRVSFYDFFVDDMVRIQEQFACKKCRHQWGGKCRGSKDSAIERVAAPVRSQTSEKGPRAPRAAAGTKSIKDTLFLELQQTIPVSNWEAFRAEYIKQCVEAGIKLSTATAAASKRRRLMNSG